LSTSRSRLFAAIALLAVTLVGAASGVAIDRYVLLPRAFARDRFGGRPPMVPRDPKDIQDRLAKELNLTDDQRRRIDGLLARQLEEVETQRRTIQPRLDSLLRSTRDSLDAILTVDQRKKLEDLRNRNAFGPPFPFVPGGRMRPGGAMPMPAPPPDSDPNS
jgi:Spy/CpxP family protein refolding chaperone